MPVRVASFQDHPKLVKIARSNEYTTGFTDIYYIEDMYDRGWIGKFEDRGKIKGFVCLRHSVRKETTVIYDVATHPDFYGRGIGRKLIEWAMRTSPYGSITLNVDDKNTSAMKFYRKLGFRKAGSGEWKSGRTYTTFKIKGAIKC